MRHPFPSKRLRIALGTWVAIEAMGAHSEEEHAAIEAAFAAIGAIEARMHPSRPGSDLAKINSAPLHTPVEVQADTWQLLKLAQRLYALTEGVFDPCLPDRPGRLPDLELASEDEEEPTVICHTPVRLDLGGIAKGHAIDRAIATLAALGCDSGLVNAGGDLRVFGKRTETIFLRRGGRDQDNGNDERSAPAAASVGTPLQFRPIDLENAALAVSDRDATERPEEHQGYYNRVGPTEGLRYAAVVAKDAATADALTKCVLLCPADTTARVLREFAVRSV